MKPSLKHLVFTLACTICLGGCAGIVRNPLPTELATQAEIPGMPGIRTWGDSYSPLFQADLVESIKQARATNPLGVVGPDGCVSVLAISGGGADGAFGAGLLCGWTATGKRPDFKLVTGISTGALIAPFAFAGSEYDHILKKFYTSVSTPDIYTERPILSLLSGTDALSDTTPLARLLEQIVDEKLLASIAKAHNQGRRLYIGTTNLDAGRLTIWNMGAIAVHGGPEALALFRHVMRASASIPVAFPPLYLKVEANGKIYDEMHVDGGVCMQVFFYGYMLDLPAAARDAGVTTIAPIKLYVIRNAQIKSYWQNVKPRLFPIAGRSVSDLLSHQGIGDLYRIYTIATRDGIEYNLASIPEDYEAKAKEMFDPAEMTRLFDTAFKLAKDGYPWRKLPPGLKEQTAPLPKVATTMPATATAR